MRSRRLEATSEGEWLGAAYTHNTLNELTGDNSIGDSRGPLGYHFDKAGNRDQMTWSGGTQAYSVGSDLNHLNDVAKGPQGAFHFDFDNEGNRIGKFVNETDGHGEPEGGSSYRWDGKNRLTQVTLPDASTIQYAYDYQNRLVSRTQGSEARTFLFGSGNQVLEESLNGQRLALYGWGADGLASRTDANGNTLFYLKDALGSVMAIVDGRGAVVQSYEFSAYGESLSGKDAVNAFRFVGGAGGYTDDATGLIQFWNRWYDPQVGKWVSEDPIRQEGGVNLYGYVDNSPQGGIDPAGLKVWVGWHPAAVSYDVMFNHSSIILYPDKPGCWASHPLFQAHGGRYATLGGQPGGRKPGWGVLGNLVSAFNYPGDSIPNSSGQVEVAEPMEDDAFISALISAAEAYRNDLPYYLFPERMFGTFNSNSYVAGVIRAAGGMPPAVPVSLPGYRTPIPIPGH